jgi:hypothetical protein
MSDPLCAYCAMPLSMHCEGNQVHTDDHKTHHVTTRCVSRHCLAPLCDCVDFVNSVDQEQYDFQKKESSQKKPAQAAKAAPAAKTAPAAA